MKSHAIKTLFVSVVMFCCGCSALHAKDGSGSPCMETALLGNDTTPLNGVYTVGDSSSDFLGLPDAIQYLTKYGVSGPVRIQIVSGSYLGPVFSGSIPGSSRVNSVTFCSAAKNCDSVKFYNLNGITLKNTSHLRFSHIEIVGMVIAVSMDSNLTDVEFRNCRILTEISNSPSFRAVNYPGVSGCYLDDVRFVSNEIRGGYYNFFLKAVSNSTSNFKLTKGVTIDSNLITKGWRAGIYAENSCLFPSISHNTIHSFDSADNIYFGIYFYQFKQWDRIEGNRIQVHTANEAYGIYLNLNQNYQNSDTAVICNNEIIMWDSGEKQGIYLSGVTGPIAVVNNSVFTNSTDKSYGLFLYNFNAGALLLISNNLFVNGNNKGAALNIPVSYSSKQYSYRDYNNYYSYGGNHVHIGADITKLEDLKSVDTNLDRHSIIQVPVWKDSNMTLEMSNLMLMRCPLFPLVSVDIEGNVRVNRQTGMGCYGFEVDSNDAKLEAFSGLESIRATVSGAVKVVLKNVGKKAISTATITLEIDHVKQPVYTYNPTLPLEFKQTDTVSVVNFLFSEGLHTLTAYIRLENDTIHENDTITIDRYFCKSGLKGTFVVGGSAKADYSIGQIRKMLFAQMNDCGISGDVTLAFEKGTHGGYLDFNIIANVMGNHHLTVVSQDNDKENTVIADSNVVVMIGSENKNITIQNLTLRSTSHNPVIQLGNGCSDIQIIDNKLLGDTVQGDYSIVLKNMGDAVRRIRIANNYFKGGKYGISMSGKNNDELNGDVVIDSNEIIDFKSCGVWLNFTHTPSLSHNLVKSRQALAGILQADGMADSVIGNVIDLVVNANFSGNSFFELSRLNNKSGKYVLVANNSVNVSANGNNYGVRLVNSPVNFYHNSIHMTGDGSGYALYCLQNATQKGSINLHGNIIDAEKMQSAVYYNTQNNVDWYMDYNCYCNRKAQFLANVNSKFYDDIAGMQSGFRKDTHSVHFEPEYKNLAVSLEPLSDSRLIISRSNLVTADITGKPRLVRTCIGAYEFEIYPSDASLVGFTNTDLVVGSNSMYVKLYNMGSDPLTSVTIRWTANGISQPDFKWTGNLPAREQQIVNIGNLATTNNTYYRIVAWTENPNNSDDADLTNDTAFFNHISCNGTLPGGSYTVGGYRPDFTDMDDVVETLYGCGIAGPVIFNIRSANHQNIRLSDSIPGASRSNVVTFVGENGATVVFDGKGENPGLYLKNVSYLHFRNLTFGNITNGIGGVEMNGMCSYVTFRNCRMLASNTATSEQYRAFSYNDNSNKTYLKEVRVANNQISGGYYNMYLYGTGGSNRLFDSSSLYVDSNTLTDGYRYGIDAYYYCAIPSMSYNRIQNRSNSSDTDTYHGIYSYYYNAVGKMEGNRIFVRQKSGVGVRMDYYQNNANHTKNPFLFVNNEIRVIGEGTQCGLYVNGRMSRFEIHHNSVYVHSTKGKAYAMRLIPCTSTGIANISRNIFMANGKDTAYAIFFENNNYRKNKGLRSWNDLYSTHYAAYADGSPSTVGQLRILTGQDSNSCNADPCFQSVYDHLELCSYDTLLCPKLETVTTDINGRTRNDTTNMGCHSSTDFITYFTVTLWADDSAKGEVSGAGRYPAGSSVRISAKPYENMIFRYWNDSVRDNPRTFVITQDTVFTAIFDNDDAVGDVEKELVAIYPNPVRDGAVFVTNGMRFEASGYEVSDVTGRIVRHGHYNSAEGIRVDGLAKGVYLLRIDGKYGKFVME